MSNYVNLKWEPVLKEGDFLPDALREILETKGWTFPKIIGHLANNHEVAFIEGLALGGVEGAEDLLKALQTNSEIRLSLENK